MNRNLNIPNTLSIIRAIFTIPIFILTIYNSYFWALILFIIASLTDLFDGMIARKLNQVTDLGKFIDQISDKIMINAIFIGLMQIKLIPGWFVATLISRDTFVSGIRMFLASKNIVVAADKLGKLKTVLQMSLIILLYFYGITKFNLNILNEIMIYTTVTVSIVSGINYFTKSLKYFS